MNRLVVRGAAGGLPAAPVRRLVARGTVTIGLPSGGAIRASL